MTVPEIRLGSNWNIFFKALLLVLVSVSWIGMHADDVICGSDGD